ncbi:hypothetical protein KAU33_02595 [Candidatus Dependentiae bacterium]|nr:hypothetical protein [Candidatus Dependentiae bacterium]
MIRNRILEEIHKRITHLLEENTENIDKSNLSDLIKECDKLGDIIYLPGYLITRLVPHENYFCPICSHYSLKTVLSDKVNKSSLADYGAVYKKTCKDCGHIYYVNAAGKLCYPEDEKQAQE